MKIIIRLLFALTFFVSNSQQTIEATFGKPTQLELNKTEFEQFPNWPAVVLYEKGLAKIELLDDELFAVNQVHKRIKVLNPEKYDGKTITISYYKGKNTKNRIKNLKAITHNGALQTYVSDTQFYKTQPYPNIESISFTFPNVQPGSIIEFQYTLLTQSFFSIDGWEFQGNIPKLYSEYETVIPSNYKYNKVLIGNLSLDVNDAFLKSGCFYIPGFAKSGDCEVGVYVMKNVPPFISEEYMLSPKNYKAKIKYEIREQFRLDGVREFFTKKWSDVDDDFRTNPDVGRQLKHKSFFRSNVPYDDSKNKIDNAKSIYYFIQNQFNWDGNYGLFADKDLKEAFKLKKGSISEINISLINALQAHDLDAKLVLMSTRENGLPTQTYPVLSEFNYALCHLTIDNEEYLLDATRKNLPFNMLPDEALNIQGRVMDFKNESYWYPIIPYGRNLNYLKLNGVLSKDGTFFANVEENKTGYKAFHTRTTLETKKPLEYLEENKPAKNEIIFENIKFEELSNPEKPLKSNYDITTNFEIINGSVYLNPFFFQEYFNTNPFTLDQRNYPIEFGHPFTVNYSIAIDLEDNYEIVSLPEDKVFKLPNSIGNCQINYFQNENELKVSFNLKIVKERIAPETYKDLKTFFSEVINAQNKDLVQLNKI